MPEIFTITMKAIFAYIYLVILARFIGRRVIAQMTFLDFGVATTFGTLVATVALGSKPSTSTAVNALLTFSVLAVVTGILSLKSIKFRKLVNSEPVVIIEKGKIVDKNMKKTRLSISELTSILRKQSAFNISDVEFAVLENDGQLSVLKKSQKQPLTPSDMNIITSYQALTKDIILDGAIMYENLESANLDEQWLLNQLNSQGIANIQDVFYAGLDSAGKLYVAKKNKNAETHGKYGIE